MTDAQVRQDWCRGSPTLPMTVPDSTAACPEPHCRTLCTRCRRYASLAGITRSKGAQNPELARRPNYRATAERSTSGMGRESGAAVMYRSTTARFPATPNCSKRKRNFASCAAMISSFSARSQSSRLKGPSAFLRVL